MDEHLGVRKRFGEKARAASVIKVDVGRQDVADRVDTEFVEGVKDVLAVGADPGVDDCRFVGVEDVDRAVAGDIIHTGVDVVEIRSVGNSVEIAGSHI